MSGVFVGGISGTGDGAVQALRRLSSAASQEEGRSTRQLAEALLAKEQRLSESLPPLLPPEAQSLERGESKSLRHNQPTPLKRPGSSHTGQVDMAL